MENLQAKKYQFYISGMYCRACVMLTESELADHPKIASVNANLADNSVEVYGDFGPMTNEEIARELSDLLKAHGYEVVLDKPVKKVVWREFLYAFPLALIFVGIFVVLQKFGIVNLVNSNEVNYGTAFLVGVVASLSTCMALVGGLVLSMSATFAKAGDRVRPQVLFHLGRIVAFFVLGGVIAVIGATFKLGVTGTFVLGMIVGIVMLILGFNLLDIFNFTKKLQPAMPKFVAEKAMKVSNLSHTVAPILVGVATFFLPCGFTQAMQLYALSTGDFMSGALTMLFFALGTLPVLALVSFSSLAGGLKSGIFFKTAGLVVIAFAAFNIINSLVLAGYIAPVFNF